MAFASKKLINDPNSVVTEFIEGLVETYPGLQYLDGFPEIKVVLRADVLSKPYDKVAVISGGGSGHEPAHAGFVGEGMLTAAVCGDVFASPSVDSILAGIRAVTGPKGCLLIVKNYTGDRLNFGLAAEQAKSEGYKIEMVIVGDDCALPPPRGIAGRRGLAGTILVHKVAGAAAASGLSLADVAAEARHASEIVGTMGVTLSVCTLPGQAISDRLGPERMELGLGIRGEPGAAVADVQPVDVVVSHVLKQILSTARTTEEDTRRAPVGCSLSLKEKGGRFEYGLAVRSLAKNGITSVPELGATPVMELMIVAGKAVPMLQLEHGLAISRVYTGSFMTSLDMTGFSISIMEAEPAIVNRLDAVTKAPHWPVGVEGDRPPAKIPIPVPPSGLIKNDEMLSRLQQPNHQGHILEVAIRAATKAIIDLTDNLNDWDSQVGDGDCGSIMLSGATAITEDMKNYPLNDAAETIKEIGSSIRRVMGGTSGTMYDILCRAAYAQLKANSLSDIKPGHWADVLEAAITAVSKYGGARAGYRTLLDALIPASLVLKERLSDGVAPVNAFVLSSQAALDGAESTMQMQAQAGRSMYIHREVLAIVPDPGAMAAAAWYRAAALAVKEEMSRASSKSTLTKIPPIIRFT